MYLWNYYADLARKRKYDSFSGTPLPIDWLELWAWRELTNTRLDTVEISVLDRLDSTFLEVRSQERAKTAETSRKK